MSPGHHHVLLLPQVLLRSCPGLLPFRIEQKLPHLGSALAQGLRCLLAGGIIPNLDPEPCLIVLLKEASIVLAYRPNNGPRDGGLVVLAGLQIGSSVQVDKIPKIASAWRCKVLSIV